MTSKSAGFHSLAPELLQEIGYQVIGSHPSNRLLTSQEASDLGILRSVCKYMNNVNAPILFRHLISATNHQTTSTYSPPELSPQLADIISAHSTNITIRMEGEGNPPEGCIEVYEPWLAHFLASARSLVAVQ